MQETFSDMGERQSISMAIVSALADAEGKKPAELEFVLNDYIDTDAVDRLVSHDSSSWNLTFELPENTVTITGEGLVEIEGLDHNDVDIR